jgi:class 3 adenylate cyclase
MAEERVERRLAPILYADVVGYSRLMGADEEKKPLPFSKDTGVN